MIAATLNDSTGTLESLTANGEADRSGRVVGAVSGSPVGDKLLPFPIWRSSTSPATRDGDGEAVACRRHRGGSPSTSVVSATTSLDSMFVADVWRSRSAELRRPFAMTQPASRVINVDPRRRRRLSGKAARASTLLAETGLFKSYVTTRTCGACAQSSTNNVCTQTARAPVDRARLYYRCSRPADRPRLPRRRTHVSQPDWQLRAGHGRRPRGCRRTPSR